MSKELKKLFEAYVCNPDVYEYAYLHCDEYKKYIDSLPEETMASIRRAHKAYKISNGSDKIRKGLFHLATFGLSYGIEKVATINSKSKDEKIVELVENENFVTFFKTLNSIGEQNNG